VGGNVAGESVEAAVLVAYADAGNVGPAVEAAHCAHGNAAAGDGQQIVGEGHVPVTVGGHSTAVEFPLHIVPESSGGILVVTTILFQRSSQRCLDQLGGVVAQHIAANASSQLQDKDNGQHDREAEHQAVVLLQGTPAPEKRDHDDKRSDHDKERGDREELAGQEELIASVDGPNSGSNGNQNDAGNLGA